MSRHQEGRGGVSDDVTELQRRVDAAGMLALRLIVAARACHDSERLELLRRQTATLWRVHDRLLREIETRRGAA